MTQQQKELHLALIAFDIDGGPVDFSFSQRLARENGWPLPYAKRVVDEYKKFVLLAGTGKHAVTPSHQVDQAWHLHMTYTESYWTRMCGELLPKPLHHNPTKGGRAEGDKFDDWYRRTLRTYEEVFGEPPPSDIWPAPETRFGRDTRNEFVNTDLNLVISKAKLRRLGQVGAAALLTLVLVGCTVREDREGLFITLMIILGIAAVVGFIYYAYKQGWLQGNNGGASCGTGGGCGGGGCSSLTDSSSGGSGGDSSGCSGGSGCGGGGCGGGGCGGGGD